MPLMFWSLLVGFTFIEMMISKLSLHLRSFDTFLAASKIVVESKIMVLKSGSAVTVGVGATTGVP